jgi:hypothetical protein
MDVQGLVEKIYEHVENDKTTAAVMACLRLARLLKDYLNIGIFLQELSSDSKAALREFLKDAMSLTEESKTRTWNRACALYFQEHDFGNGDDPNVALTVFTMSIEEIDTDIVQLEKGISELETPNGMTPFDTAAFNDRYTARKVQLRIRIGNLLTVKSRIKARCFNYATEVEKQLEAQERPKNFVLELQSEVNNYFKERDEEVYKRLISASELVDSLKSEDHSLLLTATRRALAAVADHFFPPVLGLVKCHDGEERKLGSDQYLNRLHEHIYKTLPTSSSRDLIRAELDVLGVFMRRINEMASKGVHVNVTPEEAKQGLLGLYVLLSNLIARMQKKDSEAPASK